MIAPRLGRQGEIDMKRRLSFIAMAAVAAMLATSADAASRRSREKVEPPPPPQFRVDGPTRKMELARVASNLAAGADIGKFSRGCALLDAYGGAPIILHPEDAFRNARPQDFINIFNAEADAAGYALPQTAQGNLFEEQNTTRAEISVGAAVTGLQVNGCFGAVLVVKLAEVEATITIDWQVFDPLQKKLLYRTTNTGYAKLKPNEYNDTIVVEGTRAAFRNAAKNILADPSFVAALRDPRATMAPPVASSGSAGFQIARLPLSTNEFRQQISDLRQQVVTVITPGGSGSGFYIADGMLLTNHHVIAGYSDVKIRFFGGREVSGLVVSSNARRDVALVQAAGGVTGLPLQTEQPQLGAQIYVIGSPVTRELEGTVTTGIVSSHRTTEEGPVIQSDVAVTHGNSGGPMFDDKGNVIALVVSGLEPNGSQIGLNFFIPIADALKTLNIDPSQPPGAAPVLVSLPGAAAAAAPPAQRDITVAMFPAAGPMRQSGTSSPLAGTVSGIGGSGSFTFTRPDNVSCTGRWTTLQTKPASGSLMDKHRDVLSMSQSTDGMVGGLAIGACSNNGSFEAEYYVTPGVDSGFGAATDSDGNIYKIIF
jgi:serine protease Do